MDSTRLVVDIGSTSKKLGLFRDGSELARTHLEQQSVPSTDYHQAIQRWLEQLRSQQIIQDVSQIDSVVIRVVAPGSRFTRHQVIDETFVKYLRDVDNVGQPHITLVLDEIERLQTWLPRARFIAASDSAFHTTMPERARRYAIPEPLARQHDLYRMGYHGLSLSSIVRQLADRDGSVPPRTVVCHLGGGVSITALLDGRSIDTSMGYSPLAGVPMSTRVGDLDPGILLAILGGHLGGEWPVSSEVTVTDVKELTKILSEESGLKALSGSSGDMKELLQKRQDGDEAAALAIDIFCYKVRQYIGAYAAALGGLDALILTGTIAERSQAIVHDITEPLAWLNVAPQVIPADELTEMAKITL